MNPEHYEKVRSVLRANSVLVPTGAEKSGTDQAFAEMQSRWSKLWEEEFGKRVASGLDLSSADLSENFFCGKYDGPFDRANFQGAKLDGTEWVTLYMDRADFTRASMRQCSMFGIFCAGALFREADLSGAKIKHVHASDVDNPMDFANANLSGATVVLDGPTPMILTGARMDGCRVHAGENVSAEEGKKALGLFLSSLSEEQRTQVILGAAAKCFIATAAYGTDQAKDVIRLRAFREAVLRRTRTGRMFIALYEASSPPLARFISRSALARSLARSLIVRPARYLADYSLNVTRRQSEQEQRRTTECAGKNNNV